MALDRLGQAPLPLLYKPDKSGKLLCGVSLSVVEDQQTKFVAYGGTNLAKNHYRSFSNPYRKTPNANRFTLSH